MPPKPPHIARYETGRDSRLIFPKGVCPDWFQVGVELVFLPLAWKDSIGVSDVRRLEALLACTVQTIGNAEGWMLNPLPLLQAQDAAGRPEQDRESLLIYRSSLSYNKGQFKVFAPPMMRGLCDEQCRLYVTEHSLGVGIWSSAAFNEHYG